MNVFAPGTHKNGSVGEGYENRDRELVAAREAARSWSNKLIVLSSSIVGFSVTLFSVDVIKKNINPATLEVSWYWLLLTIVMSTCSVILESRAVFASLWRKNALGTWAPDSVNKAPTWVYFNAVIIFIFALLYPTHAMFDKDSATDKPGDWQKAHIVSVGWLARTKNLAYLLETLSLISFIFSLWYLIKSVGA